MLLNLFNKQSHAVTIFRYSTNNRCRTVRLEMFSRPRGLNGFGAKARESAIGASGGQAKDEEGQWRCGGKNPDS